MNTKEESIPEAMKITSVWSKKNSENIRKCLNRNSKISTIISKMIKIQNKETGKSLAVTEHEKEVGTNRNFTTH